MMMKDWIQQLRWSRRRRGGKPIMPVIGKIPITFILKLIFLDKTEEILVKILGG